MTATIEAEFDALCAAFEAADKAQAAALATGTFVHPTPPAEFKVLSGVRIKGSQLFQLGKVWLTPGAVKALAAARQKPIALLRRHARGDWGNMSLADRELNDRSIPARNFLMSEYCLPKTGVTIWVITQGYIDVTTVLLPEEY